MDAIKKNTPEKGQMEDVLIHNGRIVKSIKYQMYKTNITGAGQVVNITDLVLDKDYDRIIGIYPRFSAENTSVRNSTCKMSIAQQEIWSKDFEIGRAMSDIYDIVPPNERFWELNEPANNNKAEITYTDASTGSFSAYTLSFCLKLVRYADSNVDKKS